MEANTSRPLLLAALERATHSDGQTTRCLVSDQARQWPDVVEDRMRPNGMMRHEVWNLQAFRQAARHRGGRHGMRPQRRTTRAVSRMVDRGRGSALTASADKCSIDVVEELFGDDLAVVDFVDAELFHIDPAPALERRVQSH
jgi:hypothetical protein